MSELLGHAAPLQEALWNFAHLESSKRITLSNNPHFYLGLPTLIDEYGGKFEAFPVEMLPLEPNATIYVLIDQPRRVFLETEQVSWVFGNVFRVKDVMIFRGLSIILLCLYATLTTPQIFTGYSRENR
jgi:hypothetical protein